jgi:hypothetical protein
MRPRALAPSGEAAGARDGEAWETYGRERFRAALGDVLDAIEWSFDHSADVGRIPNAEVDELWRIGCDALAIGRADTRAGEPARERDRFGILEWRDGALRSESAAHSDAQKWMALRRRIERLLGRTRR